MALSMPAQKKRRLLRQPSRARPTEPESETDSEQEAARALFKRHFEQQFAPLPQDIRGKHQDNKKTETTSVTLGQEQDSSDFGGFETDEEDEAEDQEAVHIVEHRDIESLDASSRAEKRSFMTSAPPRRADQRATEGLKAEAAEDERSEKLNLKNDLELQRLINESHLLDPSKKPDKQQRQRITDLRLQSLGSKGSILQQANMPMAHRKGIKAKKDRLEKKRRQEAMENGVVLEKAVHKAPSSQAKRDRGVGGPAIGRYKGGTLSLSQRDVAAITRPRRK